MKLPLGPQKELPDLDGRGTGDCPRGVGRSIHAAAGEGTGCCVPHEPTPPGNLAGITRNAGLGGRLMKAQSTWGIFLLNVL